MPLANGDSTPSEILNWKMEGRRRADEALRAAKRRIGSPQLQIDRGVAGDASAGTLASWVATALNGDSAPHSPRANDARLLLAVVLERRSALLRQQRYVEACVRLARVRHLWGRRPEDWTPRTHNAGRQLADLARHLLADYPVPAWLDQAWLGDDGLRSAARNWFAHIGVGQNLRTAPDLPFPLNKRMAHVAMSADAELSPAQALRWAQLAGLGVADRIARAVALTRLGQPTADEPFWLSFGHLLANHPMLDPGQVGPIVDYLFAQKFEPIGNVWDGRLGRFRFAGPPQPGLSMKGRTVESLLRQVRQWHRTLGKGRDDRNLTWGPSGIPGLNRAEGEPGRQQRRFVIHELLTSAELLAEGRAMRHCVYSYAGSCASGRCAIFSFAQDVGTGLERRATIEVIRATKTIVQARGRLNERPSPVDQRVIRAWAVRAGLTVGQVF